MMARNFGFEITGLNGIDHLGFGIHRLSFFQCVEDIFKLVQCAACYGFWQGFWDINCGSPWWGQWRCMDTSPYTVFSYWKTATGSKMALKTLVFTADLAGCQTPLPSSVSRSAIPNEQRDLSLSKVTYACVCPLAMNPEVCNLAVWGTLLIRSACMPLGESCSV